MMPAGHPGGAARAARHGAAPGGLRLIPRMRESLAVAGLSLCS
jgi:hypothetical protein